VLESKKKRRRIKKFPKQKLAIALILIIAIIVMGIVVLHQTRNKTNQPKRDPNEYFQFLDPAAFASRVSQSIIRIKTLSFSLKPIGGDAHHVVIFADGMANPQDYYYLEIKNGTEVPVEIQFSYSIQVSKKGEAYPVTLKIWSDEAEGEVTLWLRDEAIVLQG